MITIRNERSTDIPARERLLDVAFGPARLAKTSQRLREDRFAADELSFSAIENGRLVGTARAWNIAIGTNRPALLLGPVAVACDAQGRAARSSRDRTGGRHIVLRPLRLQHGEDWNLASAGTVRIASPAGPRAQAGRAQWCARGRPRYRPQGAGRFAGVPHWLPLDPIFSTSRLNNTFAE
jgi:hypothetical protein